LAGKTREKKSRKKKVMAHSLLFRRGGVEKADGSIEEASFKGGEIGNTSKVGTAP